MEVKLSNTHPPFIFTMAIIISSYSHRSIPMCRGVASTSASASAQARIRTHRSKAPLSLWLVAVLSCLVARTFATTNVPLDNGAAILTPRGGSSPDLDTIRVAYQGEPGAYSEKATRELLGRKVTAVGRPSFEACFRAVASRECDYACKWIVSVSVGKQARDCPISSSPTRIHIHRSTRGELAGG
jgi:hypothetical protein